MEDRIASWPLAPITARRIGNGEFAALLGSRILSTAPLAMGEGLHGSFFGNSTIVYAGDAVTLD